MNDEIAGLSLMLAVPVIAEDSEQGIELENAIITSRFGERGCHWDKVGQMLIRKDGRAYDRISIQLAAGQIHMYFDITSFLGSK